jgi:hypothetical protein
MDNHIGKIRTDSDRLLSPGKKFLLDGHRLHDPLYSPSTQDGLRDYLGARDSSRAPTGIGVRLQPNDGERRSMRLFLVVEHSQHTSRRLCSWRELGVQPLEVNGYVEFSS